MKKIPCNPLLIYSLFGIIIISLSLFLGTQLQILREVKHNQEQIKEYQEIVVASQIQTQLQLQQHTHQLWGNNSK